MEGEMIHLVRFSVGHVIGAMLLVMTMALPAWSEEPSPQPARKGGPVKIFGQDDEPAQEQDQGEAGAFPDFLRPGARITYLAGSSVVQGVNSQVVPDEKGNLVDPQTGKHYRTDDMKSSGGIGYVQINIVSVDPRFVAADVRNFLISDPQNNLSTSTSAAALTGDGNALDMYWINPAQLAHIDPRTGRGTKITRIQYTLNGRNYNAISYLRANGSAYTSRIYDLRSGLLLAESSSDTGGTVPTLDKNNTITPCKGATYITHSRFLAVRQVDIPWAEERTPQWVARGRQLDYQGSYTAVLPSGPLPGLGMAVSFSIGQVNNGCALTRMTTRSELGTGLPPQETTADRCFGTAMLSGLWVPPQALRQLEPNQVIDEDPITNFRTTFAGLQGQSAVFVEQGPLEFTQAAYDTQTGLLQALRSSRKQPTGEIQVQLQLAGRR